MISKDHSKLSVAKQCNLLGSHRSGVYYKPKQESPLNLELMKLMDEHYNYHPFKGATRMHTWLTLDKGFDINHKRVERLYYDVMGLRAIMPGKHTSKRNKAHKTYPYLLRNLKVTKPNQVWATDITYIPMEKGFMYLTAIIDLYKYLSMIINQYKEKGFSEYINDLRIEYLLKQLMKDKQLINYTIKAMAFECGFSNSESFSKHFFRKTGLYPSFYIKELKKTL